MLIELGHYASDSFSKPSKKSSYFSLTDEECNGVVKSVHLDPSIVNQLLPHPIAWQMIWSQKKGEKSFYAWKAIPPDEKFEALGMVGTTSPEEPPLNGLRCIPKAWLKVTKSKPKKLWDDSGTGGRPGSFWITTSMQLLVVTTGHDAPPGPHYEIEKDKFLCNLGFAAKDFEAS